MKIWSLWDVVQQGPKESGQRGLRLRKIFLLPHLLLVRKMTITFHLIQQSILAQ